MTDSIKDFLHVFRDTTLGVNPITLPDTHFYIQDWVSMTYGENAAGDLSGSSANRLSLFWCFSIFWWFQQNSTFTKSNIVRALLKIFSFVFSFCEIKDYCLWKHNFCRLCICNPASGLVQIGHKRKNDNAITISNMTLSLTFFDIVFFCQV